MPCPPSAARPGAGFDEAGTLYAASPYATIDARRRERAAEAEARRNAYGARHPLFFGPSRRFGNPTLVTVVILVVGLAYVYLPLASLTAFLARCSSAARLPPTSIMPAQQTFTLASRSKGCHLVQSEVETQLREMLRGVKVGMLTLFLQHTSAALSLNENCDRDVRTDMDMALDRIVPESLPWRHTDEGPDDSVSHTKSSLVGPSVTIPITDGRMNLGTWQGIVGPVTDPVPVRVPARQTHATHRSDCLTVATYNLAFSGSSGRPFSTIVRSVRIAATMLFLYIAVGWPSPLGFERLDSSPNLSTLPPAR